MTRTRYLIGLFIALILAVIVINVKIISSKPAAPKKPAVAKYIVRDRITGETWETDDWDKDYGRVHFKNSEGKRIDLQDHWRVDEK